VSGSRDVIGVIGGMGPLASADFFRKVIEETPATRDEDHVPLLIVSDPRVPSRPAAILGNGESPLPVLRSLRDRLIDAGAVALAMPCITAHHWYDELAFDCPVPFLSIVAAGCEATHANVAAGARVAVIGTRATLATRLFDRRLNALGHETLQPTDDELAGAVLPAIEKVKAGSVSDAGVILKPAIESLLDRGAEAVVLACTETPIAIEAVDAVTRDRCIDPTRALAHACVRLWQERVT
jgi:aspartate racemase